MATQTFARSALTAHERPVLRRRRKPSACGSTSAKFVSCRSRVLTCVMIGFRLQKRPTRWNGTSLVQSKAVRLKTFEVEHDICSISNLSEENE